jgi:hypothetical protein
MARLSSMTSLRLSANAAAPVPAVSEDTFRKVQQPLASRE